MPSISITADDAPLMEAIQSLSNLSGAPQEFVDRVVNAFQFPSKLAVVEVDSAATFGTSDVRLVFKPSKLLTEFVMAARTFDLDGRIGEDI